MHEQIHVHVYALSMITFSHPPMHKQTHSGTQRSPITVPVCQWCWWGQSWTWGRTGRPWRSWQRKASLPLPTRRGWRRRRTLEPCATRSARRSQGKEWRLSLTRPYKWLSAHVCIRSNQRRPRNVPCSDCQSFQKFFLHSNPFLV